MDAKRTTIPSPGLLMIVGTYTSSGSQGVYAYGVQPVSGTPTQLAAVQVLNPSYVAINPDHSRIYAVSENGPDDSMVAAIGLDCHTGRMRVLGSVNSCGWSPCHIAMIGTGALAVANYGSGSLAVLGINADGTVAACRQLLQWDDHGSPPRQATSHLHFSMPTPDGRRLIATNLGGDCLYVMRIGHNGSGTPTLSEERVVRVADGCGPRHFVFSRSGTMLHVLTELSCEVMTFGYSSESGRMQLLQSVKIAQSGAGGDIQLSPDGLTLYASVRCSGCDGVAIMRITPEGLPEVVAFQPTGGHPRSLAITPDGRLLMAACRDSNAVQVYARNAKSGLLTHVSGSDVSVSMPVCVKFVDPNR